MKNGKTVLKACVFSFVANFILFAVKLYIGLRTNSISIYSDAVNNMFDSISGAVTFTFLYYLMKKSSEGMGGMLKKSEQLFSFVISVTVVAAGFYFGYTSLERLIYPTPVWFSTLYAAVVAATAGAKAVMFFIYSAFEKKSGSPVVRVMKFDCILDMFITVVSVITLLVSQYSDYAIDAVCGLVISIIILISAAKMLISNAKKLIDYVPSATRDKVSVILTDYSDSFTVNELDYQNDGDSVVCYVSAQCENNAVLEIIMQRCLDEANVRIGFVMK
ncbi:MAG TPA: hypothetical protein DCY15_07390 [Ruminococcaceae bacterium]|nr:hypothetical protein [Oscillospiraceae bacterium]